MRHDHIEEIDGDDDDENNGKTTTTQRDVANLHISIITKKISFFPKYDCIILALREIKLGANLDFQGL